MKKEYLRVEFKTEKRSPEGLEIKQMEALIPKDCIEDLFSDEQNTAVEIWNLDRTKSIILAPIEYVKKILEEKNERT